MSVAGVRSNRGDLYQTLVAFDWALTVLSIPEFQWLEIDSTTFQVDDVVISKSDGSLICCQCKKNQTDFRAWSIADLVDELDKAFVTLVENPHAQVYFYSRSEFGVLAKLREFCVVFAMEEDYLANLTKEHTKTNDELAACIARQSLGISTYDFLRRTSFQISPDYERMEALLNERLRGMVSNSGAAFAALWTRLNKLGGRMEGGDLSASTQDRLTKSDLEEILNNAGAMLVPIMSIVQVRTAFAGTSAIGRSWHRDIAGERISSPVVNELLATIDAKKRTVLLTGLPGAGKTCVMLSLQEELEQRMQTRGDLVALFIQSREFVDFETTQERQAQGLPEQWVEQAARLAEDTHVVVVIDSLDVLSIAREHKVLTYFLAQIDQLLLIPNITVITACRDFDRKYDRRIAVRKWDSEIQCLPLDWEIEVVPLLAKLEIDSTRVDADTRKLICNPRELALFVELAQREGSFNVVSSQVLSQRYLDRIIQDDPLLGGVAMQAIEGVADAMLKSRSLSVPYQRFTASQNILRRLQSLNIVQQTHGGKLTFGHQTLMDVLVISGAIRQGFTLNAFIQGLPPVPFVRPSIRSFVAQLEMGDRREFRKQMRTVLMGNAAFHIRRLIAELFAQQVPQDKDWPLIRDLREKHPEVYQVIYTQALLIEWHHFWLLHLVPALKEMHDVEGLMFHVHRIAQWGNEDAAGVFGFWAQALALDWLDSTRIAEHVAFSLPKFKAESLMQVSPLLEQMLVLPKSEHGMLGHTVARCIAIGVVDDTLLWDYIVSEISDGDVMELEFGGKLHCQSEEFGEETEKFLTQRMMQSTVLLDLALETVEQWRQIESAHYGKTRIGYRYGYLDSTSYSDVHSQTDDQHEDGERILFDAIEAGILDHAQKNTEWWEEKRERLCFNHEGALCYFGILALTNSPLGNADLIGRLLCDRSLLEFRLEYELGTLIQTAFAYLDSQIQDAVMATIQTVWKEQEKDSEAYSWILKKRAEFISAIPCYLRSEETQAILEAYETRFGILIRRPLITMWSGAVIAPLLSSVFLEASNKDIIRLLAHYAGYARDVDNFFVGGEEKVGWQLHEASSLQPSRFLTLLTTEWSNISAHFRDDMMDGVASYLLYRCGNTKPSDTWEPLEEPDPSVLMGLIFDELERHPSHWRLNRSTAQALEACAEVIQDTKDAERLVLLATEFGNLLERSVASGNSADLLSSGINAKCEKAVEALMIVANNFHERGVELPKMLPPLLHRFADNENPAIHVVILRRLPYLQRDNPNFGWELFHLAMENSTGLWKHAEKCLYYAYRDHFDRVGPLLEQAYREGNKKDLETWGRVSALSCFAGHIDLPSFLVDLHTRDVTEAWQGAAGVWAHTGNIRRQREQCLIGLEAGLQADFPHALAVARRVGNIFRETTSPISVPIELLKLCFDVFESDKGDKYHRLFGFGKWLNAISQRDPSAALAASEIYLAQVSRTKTYFHDYKNEFVQFLSRLFAEAEEVEGSDHGAMLKRVVAVQDLLLTLGVDSIDEWLKAAERQ